MTEKERIEANLEKNKPFITAFQYFADYLTEGSKKGLCELMGMPPSRISEILNGKKPVNEKAIDALIRVSATKQGMQIYSEYLHGNSDIMLLANVTDEEMVEASLRKSNPDYEAMKRRRGAEHPTPQPEQRPSIDPSSELNAALSAYVQLTNRLTDDLKRKEQELSDRLADRDAVIAEKSARIITLERTIADKEEIIRARDARIAQLESQLAEIHLQDISRYPFALGAAEGKNTQMFPQTLE